MRTTALPCGCDHKVDFVIGERLVRCARHGFRFALKAIQHPTTYEARRLP